MAISKKKRQELLDAIRLVSDEILKDYAPETLEHAPESWNPESRNIFDIVSLFEMKACDNVIKVLTE